MILKVAALLLKAFIIFICWRASGLLFDGKYSTECGAAAIIIVVTMVLTTVTAVVFHSKKTESAALIELFGNLSIRFVTIVSGVVLSVITLELHKGVFALLLLGFYILMLLSDNLRLYKKYSGTATFEKELSDQHRRDD